MTNEQMRQRIAELEEGLKYFLDRTWFNLISGTLPDNHVVSMDARVGDLRRAASLLSSAPPPASEPDKEALINHMVERFLSWRLPENFCPDGGISFKADYNEHTDHLGKHEPCGTNLLDAQQAKEMVRAMLSGYSAPVLSASELEADVVERVARAIGPYLLRSYSGTNPDVDDQARGRDTAMHVAKLAISAMRPAIDQEKLAEIRRKHIATSDCIEQGNHRWDDFSAEAIHNDRAALLAINGGGDE